MAHPDEFIGVVATLAGYDEDMLYGKRRDPAQIELELYILCQVLLGMEWNEALMGKWFWQSKEDKDLVILKQWIQPGNNPTNNK